MSNLLLTSSARRTAGGWLLLGLTLTARYGSAQTDSDTALDPAGRLPGRAATVGRLARQTTPAVMLIGLGVATMRHRTAVSSWSTADEISEHYAAFRTHADDYMQYAPYAGLAAAALWRAPLRDDPLNTLLLAAKAEALMAVTVTALKHLTHELRPDGSSYNSFPSGHTAQAFVAATVLATELRNHPWAGAGAYVVAAGVGTLRMLNQRHWQSDVLAGAGIGILATRVAYATHRYPWGHRPPAGAATRPQAWLLPTAGPRYAGVVVGWQW